MSWLTDLAGKAENILNRLDQNAAIALQKANAEELTSEPLIGVTWEHVNSSICDGSNSSESQKIMKHGIYKSSSKLDLSKKKQSGNENLICLNDDGKVCDASNAKPEELEGVVVDSNLITNSESVSYKLSSYQSPENSEENITNIVTMQSSAHDIPKQNIEILDATTENVFLKNELSVANNEVTRLASKLKISGKDVATLKSTLANLQLNYDNILKDYNKPGSSTGSLTSIQKKNKYESSMKNLESKLKLISDERDLFKQKLQTRQQSDIETKQNYFKLENEILHFQKIETDMKDKLKHSEEEIQSISSDWQLYRARAQNTLQLKEKLINELKNSVDHKLDGHINDELQLELEQARQERDMALEEVTMVNNRLETTRGELKSLQITFQCTQDDLKKIHDTLHDKFINESILRSALEEDYNVQTKEIKTLREEFSKQNALLSKTIQDRDHEMNKLLFQINKQNLPSSELEDRIHTLTQSLVSKQNALETLTADRNALRLQVEKIENKHRATLSQLRQQTRGISINDTDDAKAQVPNFLLETPFDTNVARRVKRVYSCLDAVGIRTGVFLRRYPIARILVICYMLLLHLWVMIVLFTYKPN